MKFGKDDCSSIEIEPFEPICSFDPIDGTTPLTLEIPTPAIVTPVPPNECACFSFRENPTDVVVVNECETTATPKCSVEIKQTDPDDCCRGDYTVTPTVEIPCMPFSVGTSVRVGNRTGDETKGTDGSFSMSVGKECCSLETSVDIRLPDCIKSYDPEKIPEVQISFCGRESDGSVSYNTHKLIEMVTDEENCTLYPEVIPFEIPCCMQGDGTLSAGETPIDKRGSTIRWELSREDCDPKLSIEPFIMDCPCFRFSPGKSETAVTACNTPGEIKVEIRKTEGSDCCEGQFDIIPSVSIPCIPFTLDEASVRVRNKNGGSDVDGGLEVSIDQACCTITPTIDLTLPKCIKNYTVPPANQIAYLDKGVKKWHTLVTYTENKDECIVDPIYHPLDIPCPLKDFSKKDEYVLGNNGTGKITFERGVKDCVPYSNISISPITIPAPIIPCLAPTDIGITVTYKKNSKAEPTEVKKNLSLSSGFKDGCMVYNGSLNMDLGTLGGSSALFSNGGDVDLVLGQDGESKILCIDGKRNGDNPTWYGGGVGDTGDNTEYDNVVCRGPVMRGTTLEQDGSPGIVTDPLTGTRIYTTVPMSKTNKDKIVEPDEAQGCVPAWEDGEYWESGRVEESPDPSEDDAATVAALSDDSEAPSVNGAGGDEEEEEELEPWTWESQANLDIVWPTGVQWDTRGVAFMQTQFVFNDSGVLSFVHESQDAVVVAPGIAVCKGEGKVGFNASGLRIFSRLEAYDKTTLETRTTADSSTSIDDEFYRIEHGLRVDAGDGLRIYGVDDGSVDPLDIDPGRQGVLEVMYGPGLRIRDINDEDGNPSYLEMPVDYPGALIPNDGKGLHVYGVTKKKSTETYEDKSRLNKLEVYTLDHDIHIMEKETGSPEEDDRLIINDKNTSGDDDSIWDATNVIMGMFDRTSDKTIPISMIDTRWIDSNLLMELGNGTAVNYDTLIEYVDKSDDKSSQAKNDLIDLRNSLIQKPASTAANVDLIYLIDRCIEAVNSVIAQSNACYSIVNILGGLGITAMHVGRAGIVLQTDAAYTTSAAVERFYDRTKPDPDTQDTQTS